MKTPRHAFTRIELLATLAALTLLGLLAVPLLANTRGDAQRAGCFSNLREVGRAARLWAGDHGELYPWRTSVGEGGTRPDGALKVASAWLEFLSLSNQLSTPRVLACPSDVRTKVASQWFGGSTAFANTGMRGNALSYFLNFHNSPTTPRSVIAGDRDFQPTSPGPTGCSPGGVNNAAFVNAAAPPHVSWTNAVHPSAGHLLLTDGSVEYVGDARLHSLLVGEESQDDYASIHYINAR
jgi:competence protein ComGC